MTPLLNSFNENANRIADTLASHHEPMGEYLASEMRLPIHARLGMQLRNLANKIADLNTRLMETSNGEDVVESPCIGFSQCIQELKESTDLLSERFLMGRPQDVLSIYPKIQSNCRIIRNEIEMAASDSPVLRSLNEEVTRLRQMLSQTDLVNLRMVRQITESVNRICDYLSNPECAIFDPVLVASEMNSQLEGIRTQLSVTQESAASLAGPIRILANQAQAIFDRLVTRRAELASVEQEDIDGYAEFVEQETIEAIRLLKRDYSIELQFLEKQIDLLAQNEPRLYESLANGEVATIIDIQSLLAYELALHFPVSFRSLFHKEISDRIGQKDPAYLAYLAEKLTTPEETLRISQPALHDLDMELRRTAQSQTQFMSRLLNVILQNRTDPAILRIKQDAAAVSRASFSRFDSLFDSALKNDVPEVLELFLNESSFSMLQPSQIDALFAYFADRKRTDAVLTLIRSGKLDISIVCDYISNINNPQRELISDFLLNQEVLSILSNNDLEGLFITFIRIDKFDAFQKILDSARADYFLGSGRMAWFKHPAIYMKPEFFKYLYEKREVSQDEFQALFGYFFPFKPHVLEFLKDNPCLNLITPQTWHVSFLFAVERGEDVWIEALANTSHFAQKIPDFPPSFLERLSLSTRSQKVLVKILETGQAQSFANETIESLLRLSLRKNFTDLVLVLVSKFLGKISREHMIGSLAKSVKNGRYDIAHILLTVFPWIPTSFLEEHIIDVYAEDSSLAMKLLKFQSAQGLAATTVKKLAQMAVDEDDPIMLRFLMGMEVFNLIPDSKIKAIYLYAISNDSLKAAAALTSDSRCKSISESVLAEQIDDLIELEQEQSAIFIFESHKWSLSDEFLQRIATTAETANLNALASLIHSELSDRAHVEESLPASLKRRENPVEDEETPATRIKLNQEVPKTSEPSESTPIEGSPKGNKRYKRDPK